MDEGFANEKETKSRKLVLAWQAHDSTQTLSQTEGNQILGVRI